MKPWVTYSLVRVGVFAVALTILLVADVIWWLAAIIAAAVGLCVAYIFFGKLRDAVALDLADRRSRPAADADSTTEDNA